MSAAESIQLPHGTEVALAPPANARNAAVLVAALLDLEAASARARAAAWWANNVPNRGWSHRELTDQLANAKAALDIALAEAEKEAV